MALLKVRIDQEQYDLELNIDNLTLGEAVLLEEHFGMDGFSEYDPNRPKILMGVFAIAAKRAEPQMTDSQALEKVGALKLGKLLSAMEKQSRADAKKRPQKAGGRRASASGQDSPPSEPGTPASPNT